MTKLTVAFLKLHKTRLNPQNSSSLPVKNPNTECYNTATLNMAVVRRNTENP